MGQVLRGSASTTHAIRALIQRSKTSNAAPSRQLGINVKTVAKWRKRDTAAAALRRHTLLSLDDGLHALQPTIAHLTRSSLHRCPQRHGISRLPDMEGSKTARKKFKRYPIGYFHAGIAEVRTGEGKLRLFVAIDRTSRFVYVELHEKAGKTVAARFPRNLIEAAPYYIHTILTDNGVRFTNGKKDRHAGRHIFGRVRANNGTEHRPTRVNHPWTNGQVERMNRTIKEATVKRHHHGNHDQPKTHLADFVAACNHARRLKTLKGLTPFEYVRKTWTKEPKKFKVNPTHHTTRLNI